MSHQDSSSQKSFQQTTLQETTLQGHGELFLCVINFLSWNSFFIFYQVSWENISQPCNYSRETGDVHSTSWNFSLHFVFIFRAAWNILIKFWNSHQSFNRNIWGKVFKSGPSKICGYEIYCVIWFQFCNSKNVKNTHGGVLFLVEL